LINTRKTRILITVKLHDLASIVKGCIQQLLTGCRHPERQRRISTGRHVEDTR